MFEQSLVQESQNRTSALEHTPARTTNTSCVCSPSNAGKNAQNTVPDKVQAIVTIVNRLGLHARPAMALVDVANTFSCEITLARKNQAVNAKSVMEVLLLAATQGSELTITARGDGAQEAIDAMTDLVARGFDEE